MHQSPHDQEDLFMATLALFEVSSIQTPTALFSFISGRDQHLSNSKEDSKESQLSLKTFQGGLERTASRPYSPSSHPITISIDKIDPSPIHLIDPASVPATFGIKDFKAPDQGEAMVFYSEEEDSFDSSPYSNIDETDQAWSSKEDGCERSCSADEYSSSEYDPGEESPEPEPPDHSQANTRFYKKGEEDECDPYPTQACNPLKKSLMPASYGVTPYKVPGRSKSTTARKAQSTPAATKKQCRTKRGNTSDYLVFSGSSMDPEVYLRWEADMK
ncbi:hypothetical protein F2Q68_00011801 [Brassica cretica]|uniref:Uncharacterized protein n=1 Tax=Brassica cretica TaxID=69181 RepID=A0A8S9KZM8_BRACR|nr:hypothetical protein F2Q68_00011801 [Brassica cretica]